MSYEVVFVKCPRTQVTRSVMFPRCFKTKNAAMVALEAYSLKYPSHARTLAVRSLQ